MTSNRSARLDALEAEIQTRGGVVGFNDSFADAAMREAFLEHVLAFEDAPETTLRERLAMRGHVPPCDLTMLIAWLAEIHVVIESTDHLDDRALQEFLMEYLDHPIEFPDLPDTVMHINVIGSGSEEDIDLYLRYYADEGEREYWRVSFPDMKIPPKESPPFDRDRFLPKAEDVR